MSYVPRFDVEISVGVDLRQAGWAANAVQYGYDNNRTYINLRGARWRDVDRLIGVEQTLLASCLTEAGDAEEFAHLWQQACRGFELPDEVDERTDAVSLRA